MRQTTLIIGIVLVALSINAQNIVTGTISDITGPLPFANVIIAGTDSGTVTDAKGNFSIETNKGDILIISYVGYTPKHFFTNNTKHLDISLETDVLDEVVIVGYGNYSKKVFKPQCFYKKDKEQRFICTAIGIEIKNTSYSDIKEKIIKTYPNPTSTGYITIDVFKQYKSIEISIHTITGQTLINQTYHHPKEKISIDLSRYPTGMYIINMVADGKSLTTQKIIRR